MQVSIKLMVMASAVALFAACGGAKKTRSLKKKRNWKN